MEETQKFLDPTPVDRDATLVTPRFDEVEAQVARPVVPLANNPLRRSGAAVRRRQWPIALVLISALAGGVVSLLAFRLYQQRQQQSQVAATQTDNQTAETDAATATEQAPLAQTEQQQAQSDSPVVFEEFDPAKEGVATGGDGDPSARARKAAEAEAKPAAAATSKEERKEEAKPSSPRAAEPRPRIAETIPAPRQVEARGENVSRDARANDDDDFFEERRERRRQRREQRREERRGPRRNIDRIKDIFEGPPPA